MSLIHVLIIKNRKICFRTMHFRELRNFLKSAKPKKPVDAGYLVVDLDENSIIDCQDAVDITRLKNLEMQKFK
jgi:hypothetical protein